MSTMKDLSGQVFGRLTAIRRGPDKLKAVTWECRCGCGESKHVRAGDLVSGRTKSCGCLLRETSATNGRNNAGKKKDRHGHARLGTSTYGIWQGMKSRCQNPGAGEYVNYGGRGIKVCERWQVFENFLADMGERPPGMHIDRIDNDGDYEPGNCRWVTPKENQRHTRKSRMISAFGETRCLAEWAEMYGVKSLTIHKRLRCGWDAERAITQPAEQRNYAKPTENMLSA